MLPDNGTYFSQSFILAVKNLMFFGGGKSLNWSTLERFVYDNEKIPCS